MSYPEGVEVSRVAERAARDRQNSPEAATTLSVTAAGAWSLNRNTGVMAGPATATPADVASAGAVGTATKYAREDHAHRGVSSIAKSGSAAIYGAATLSAGSGIALTQAASDVQIALTGGGGAGGAPILIAEQILASAVATVTFSAIPGTYRHLMLCYVARSSNAANSTYPRLQFNGDTATTYDNQQIQNYGSILTGAAYLNYAGVLVPPITADSATAGYAGCGTVHISDYGRTTYKTKFAVSHGLVNTGAAGHLHELWAGNWRPTTAAAITQIDVKNVEGNFMIGSIFSLYGLP